MLSPVHECKCKIALNDEMNIRIHTVEVLGLIGTAAKPEIPSLIGMLNDSVKDFVLRLFWHWAE